MTGKNIDAFSILIASQQMINNGRENYGSRVITTDSY